MQVNSRGQEIKRASIQDVIKVYFGGFEAFENGGQPSCKDHLDFKAFNQAGAVIHLRKWHGIYVNKRRGK